MVYTLQGKEPYIIQTETGAKGTKLESNSNKQRKTGSDHACMFVYFSRISNDMKT